MSSEKSEFKCYVWCIVSVGGGIIKTRDSLCLYDTFSFLFGGESTSGPIGYLRASHPTGDGLLRGTHPVLLPHMPRPTSWGRNGVGLSSNIITLHCLHMHTFIARVDM